MSRKIRRDMEVIVTELQAALKRETADIIAIGGLLLEARDQLEHGAWLVWLGENFERDPRTAENYMNAARLSNKFKFETISNLKLRPTALYLLGRALEHDPYGLYPRKTINAILKAAETEPITAERAEEIAVSLRPPPKPAIEEAEAAPEVEKTAQEEADDILAGPPPELPPAAPTVHDVTLPPFEQAVGTLVHLQTKQLGSFVATTHEPKKLRDVSRFLQEVADAIEKKIAAPPCGGRA
jgi:hypothetical protein